MLDQSKRKRLNLTQALPQRPRLSSVEKRKMILANLQDFQKGLDPKNNTVGSFPQVHKAFQNKQIGEETPTMKDLPYQNYSRQVRESQYSHESMVESPRFKQKFQQVKQNKPSNYLIEKNNIQNSNLFESVEQQEIKNQEIQKQNFQANSPADPNPKKQEEIKIDEGQNLQKSQSFKIDEKIQENESNNKVKNEKVEDNQINIPKQEITNTINNFITTESNISVSVNSQNLHNNNLQKSSGNKNEQQIINKEQNNRDDINFDESKEQNQGSQSKIIEKDAKMEKFQTSRDNHQRVNQYDDIDNQFNKSQTKKSQRKKTERSQIEDSIQFERSQDTYSHQGRSPVNTQFNYSITQASIDIPANELPFQHSNRTQQPSNYHHHRTYSPKNIVNSKNKNNEQPTITISSAKNEETRNALNNKQLSKISEQFQPSYEKPPIDDELNFNYNQSKYGSSSNNSSAIFFTSQFKQYLNRQKLPQQQQNVQDIHQNIQNNESNSESVVQELVNRKLDTQLVLEIGHFSSQNLVPIFDAYYCQIWDNFCGCFRNISKMLQFERNMQRRIKRESFDAFLINKQFEEFEQTKNNIKCERFVLQKKDERMKDFFNAWKEQCSTKKLYIMQFSLRRDAKMKANIFKIFRMLWYDARVSKQADLYFLSKIFSNFREVIIREKKKQEHAALRLYCQNLKKRYFSKLCEGVQNVIREREIRRLAKQHYYHNLLKKYFDAWTLTSNREPQFIRLTMTSKNAFKETADHKWLQTKTVDFKQIK